MSELAAPVTGEVDIQDPTRGVCFGKDCSHMSWLVDAVIERDYQEITADQKPQIAADETDYAARECVRLPYCLAQDSIEADGGAQ